MSAICKENKEEALEEAKKLSKENNTILFVIESNINEKDEIKKVWYIDDSSFIRVWETCIATYENGIEI